MGGEKKEVAVPYRHTITSRNTLFTLTHSLSLQQHSNSVPPSQASSLSTTAAYAPLTMTTRDQPSLYEQVGPSSGGGGARSPAVARQPNTSTSAGLYQSLGMKDTPSAYEVSLPLREIVCEGVCVLLLVGCHYQSPWQRGRSQS